MELLSVREAADLYNTDRNVVERRMKGVEPDAMCMVRGQQTRVWSRETIERRFEEVKKARYGTRSGYHLLRTLCHNLYIPQKKMLETLDQLNIKPVRIDGELCLDKPVFERLRTALIRTGHKHRSSKYNEAKYKIEETLPGLDPDTMMSAKEAAEYFGVWPRTVKVWIDRNPPIYSEAVNGLNGRFHHMAWRLRDIKACRDKLFQSRQALRDIRKEETLARTFHVNVRFIREVAHELSIQPFFISGKRGATYYIDEYRMLKRRLFEMGYKSRRVPI